MNNKPEYFRIHEENDKVAFQAAKDERGQLKNILDAQEEDHKRFDGKLNEILAQTKETNGRVSTLERWQSFIKGGLTILAILVVPILLYVITKGL